MGEFGNCYKYKGGRLIAMVHRGQLYRKCNDGEFRLITRTKNLYKYVFKMNVWEKLAV